MQEVVRFFAGYRIKQHASLLVSVGRLMIWVSALRPYSPGGMLNTFVHTCMKLFIVLFYLLYSLFNIT